MLILWNFPNASRAAQNALAGRMRAACLRPCSTETAFLGVHHDIAQALDDSRVVLIIIFNLSKGFHVVDHCILFKELSSCFFGKYVMKVWYF